MTLKEEILKLANIESIKEENEPTDETKNVYYYVGVVYKEPKEFKPGDSIDTESVKSDLMEKIKFFDGELVKIIKETETNLVILARFKRESCAKYFKRLVNGRTKKAKFVDPKDKKWWM